MGLHRPRGIHVEGHPQARVARVTQIGVCGRRRHNVHCPGIINNGAVNEHFTTSFIVPEIKEYGFMVKRRGVKIWRNCHGGN